MVGDTLARFRYGCEAAGVDQFTQQLGVVNNVVVATNLWVLALEGVEAVRAGDNNFGCFNFIQHLNILLGLHLVQEFITSAPGRVSRTGFAIAKDHELHTSSIKKFSNGFGSCLGTIFKRSCAANPK